MSTPTVKCPNCGAEISLSTSDYNSIARQVRDQEFDSDLRKRETELQTTMNKQVEVEVLKKQSEMQAVIQSKDQQISNITAELTEAKSKANNFCAKQANQIAVLQKELTDRESMQAAAVAKAVAETTAANAEKLNQKDIEINSLKNNIGLLNASKNTEITKAVAERDRQIAKLTADLANLKSVSIANEAAIKEKYEALMKAQREELERLKDFKSKLSVKLIGESLETHCSTEYESVRAYMPNSYFEKDNDTSITGTKGDFIFRDFTGDGTEYISIMFEMKNESDDSTHKHKNEDFFAKLDKDRKAKHCEYAVLVTMLEPDSELYNRGIVDVSHIFPKMYVIRPQFFLPMISLLRSAAQDSLDYMREIVRLKAESIDVTHFEEDLQEYKDSISRSHELATKKKNSAIEKIDKTIKLLQQVKIEFESFDKHMAEADEKAERLTIKKLAKDSPTVKELFDKESDSAPEAGGDDPTASESDKKHMPSVRKTEIVA